MNKLICVLLIVLLASACNDSSVKQEALRFKEEYESLNGKENDSEGKHSGNSAEDRGGSSDGICRYRSAFGSDQK